MRMTRGLGGVLLVALLAVCLSYPVSWAAQNVDNYFAQPTGGGTDNALNLDGTWNVDGTSVTATGVELNLIDGVTATTAELNTLDGVTATFTELNLIDGYTGTTAELNQLAGQGSANSKTTVSEGCTFTEDATNATHTCTVTIPAGSWLNNIQVVTTVLWTDAETSLSVGDADAATGWFNDVDLAATDLLVGEVLDITNAENWGGTQGAYLVAATGVKGQAVAAYSGVYVASATEVLGVVTMTTPSGTAGRTHMVVTYTTPTLVAATAAS